MILSRQIFPIVINNDSLKKLTLDLTVALLQCFFELFSNIQKQPPEEFYKKSVLWNFTKSTGKHLCLILFFNKVAGQQVFSCEFCEISQNTFFTEHLWATASEHSKRIKAFNLKLLYFVYFVVLIEYKVRIMISRSSHPRYYLKKLFWYISGHLQENACDVLIFF